MHDDRALITITSVTKRRREKEANKGFPLQVLGFGIKATRNPTRTEQKARGNKHIILLLLQQSHVRFGP